MLKYPNFSISRVICMVRKQMISHRKWKNCYVRMELHIIPVNGMFSQNCLLK